MVVSPLGLSRPVGRRQPNDAPDVARLGRAFARLGYFLEDDERPDQAWRLSDVSDALGRFQRSEGLTTDGYALPGGESERRLARRLAEQEAQDRRRAALDAALPPEEMAAARDQVAHLPVAARERLLTQAGFDYEPDRLGRLGAGTWRDRDGRRHESSELDQALVEMAVSRGASKRQPALARPLHQRVGADERRFVDRVRQPSSNAHLAMEDRGSPAEDAASSPSDREKSPSVNPDVRLRDNWGGPVEPPPIPTLNNREDRRRSILNNTPARFDILDDSADQGDLPAAYEFHGAGRDAVLQYGPLVDTEIGQQGGDADLIRAILYVENARGYLDWIRPGGATSIRPMNINPTYWKSLGGLNPENARDPVVNIRAGVKLINRIAERIKNPNPRKIAALYHFIGQERTEMDPRNYAARVDYVYRNRLWESDILDVPQLVP